jgi:hypothetical protein
MVRANSRQGRSSELQAMLERVDKLRKELEEAEDGLRTEEGSSGGWRNDSARTWSPASKQMSFTNLPSTSRQAVGCWRKGGQSSPLSKSGGLDSTSRKKVMHRTLQMQDPVGPAWVEVKDIPPLEVNRLGCPSGAFWDHMRPFVFDRGAYIFPWHLDWHDQCPELKTSFLFRLRQIYKGPWEAKGVLAQLGNSLREKRNRLKKRFKFYSHPKAVPRPRGCTVESWEQIFRDLQDPKKKTKSDLCKAKADERVASGVSPFSHKCGRGGYKVIVARFVSGPHFATSLCFRSGIQCSHYLYLHHCMGNKHLGSQEVLIFRLSISG